VLQLDEVAMFESTETVVLGSSDVEICGIELEDETIPPLGFELKGDACCIELEYELETPEVGDVVQPDEDAIFEPPAVVLGSRELAIELKIGDIELEDETRTDVRLKPEEETCCVELVEATRTLFKELEAEACCSEVEAEICVGLEEETSGIELGDATCWIELEEDTSGIEVGDEICWIELVDARPRILLKIEAGDDSCVELEEEPGGTELEDKICCIELDEDDSGNELDGEICWIELETLEVATVVQKDDVAILAALEATILGP